MDIEVLKESSACAQPPFVAPCALLRATRFLPREILTLPHRRLSAPLLHHGPPPATPRPMTYHPRVNATAHGPRPTRQRPTASATTPHRQRRSSHDAAPTTQPGQRCRGARAKLTAPPYASAVTRAHSDAAPDEATTNAAQRRHTRPTQQPPHEAPPQRHPSDAAPHDVTRAPEQSIRAPHSYPTTHQCSDTGRGAKHHRAPSTTGQLGYTTTPRTSSMTRRNPPECNQETRGCLSALPPFQRTTANPTNY